MTHDLLPSERAALDAGRCPTCGHSGAWVLGPRGGLSRNIECGNCAARFNVASYGGQTIHAERIPTEAEGGSRW